MVVVSSHETLGLLLVRDGLITRPQLYDALRLQRQNNRLLGTCLLSLGYLEPEVLLQILSRQLAIPALPPGTLSRAANEAVRRVPGSLALSLRVLPYSWDGKMLGVAVTDGRALNHLHEIAFHSQSAVGAYVALEIEIEATLRELYPEEASAGLPVVDAPVEAAMLAGRPRPARVGPLSEVPTLDFGAALGLESDKEPVLLDKRKTSEAPVIHGAPPRAPIEGPPPAADNTKVERMAFYDAVEKIYDVSTVLEIGQIVARALLNYFSRVLVMLLEDHDLVVVAHAGVETPSRLANLGELPALHARLAHRSIAYGAVETDPRGSEIITAFGLSPAPTTLIAPIADPQDVRLLVYADNGEIEDLYDDLHDVELLFKEAETALGLLVGA